MDNKKLHAHERPFTERTVGIFVLPKWFSKLLVNPLFILVATLAAQFSAAALLSRGTLLEAFAPLGVAFVAAAAAYPYRGRVARRLMPVAAMSGAIFGYMTARGPVDGLKYCAAVILCAAAGMVFTGASIFRRRWFAPAVGAFALLSTNTVYLLASFPSTARTFLFIFEVIACSAAAYFYIPLLELAHGPREAKSEKPPYIRGPGLRAPKIREIIISCASLVICLANVAPFANMSLGRTAALFLTLAAATQGTFIGCTAGLGFGFALDLAAGSAPVLAAAYAITGLFSGMFRKYGPFAVIIAFTAAHAALVPWAWEVAPLSIIYESFAAGVIFFLTKGSLVPRLEKLIPAGNIAGATARVARGADGDAVHSKISKLLTAFDSVAASMRTESAVSDERKSSVFAVAIERTCRGCQINEVCWRREFGQTRTALSEAESAVIKRGRAVGQDFPPHFAARCIKLGDFIANTNECISLRDSRARYRKRAQEDIKLLGSQYDAMTRVLREITDDLGEEDASDENITLRRALAEQGVSASVEVLKKNGRYRCVIRSPSSVSQEMLRAIEDAATVALDRKMRAAREDEKTLCEAELLRATVGVGLKTRRNEEESGDSAAYFRTDGGELYMVVSDGMGSGRDAQRERHPCEAD